MSTHDHAPTAPVTERRSRWMLRPLAASTYLLRNVGKTIPLIAVIMLAVLLVTSVIAMMNSIPHSIRTIYGYSKESLGLSPRGDPTQTMKIVEMVTQNPPVPIDRVVICRATSSQVRSIVGKWPFVVLGLAEQDMDYYLKRQQVTRVEGRLPKAGSAEVLISRPVATNLNLGIGGLLQGPDLNESYSPKPVKVVGIAETDRWLMVGSVEYQRANHFPPIDLAMVFTKDPNDQDRFDHWAEKQLKGQRAQIWAYFQIEKNTREMFKTLYQVLNVVIATLVLVITFMMGMLINIYQSQRLVEFGLLQAIGYTKRQLLSRVIVETVMVVVVGWAMGLAAGYGLLQVAKRVLMDPNAYALDTTDPMAYTYTVPIPLSILIVAVSTVLLRFRRFDPVGVVERRLV